VNVKTGILRTGVYFVRELTTLHSSESGTGINL